MAYLDASKQAAIQNSAKVHAARKREVGYLVEEVAAAIAAHRAANVAELDLNASAAYVEAEVQSIADKIDAVIAALVAAGLMAAP